MGHRGLIFHLPGFDSCGEKGKVGSELMCLFVEKLLSFKKSMRPRAKRSLKESSRDALRKRLNFHSPFFKDIFYLFDASSISDYKCSMYNQAPHPTQDTTLIADIVFTLNRLSHSVSAIYFFTLDNARNSFYMVYHCLKTTCGQRGLR